MKVVLCIALLIRLYPAFPQKITVSTSTPHLFNAQVNLVRTADGCVALDFDANSQLYAFNPYASKHRINLLKYDTAFSEVKKIELANGKKVFGPFIPVIKRLYNKVRLFYYQRREKEDKIDFLHSVIDPQTLEISSPQTILTIPHKNLGHLEVKDLVDNWMLSMQHSPDLSKLLILWNAGKDNNFYYTVLDSSMQILRTKTETSAGIKEFRVHNAAVDNAGSVYVAYGQDRIYVDKAGADAKTFTVDAGEKLSELFISPAPDGRTIHLAGVFRSNDEILTGAYSQDLDITNGTYSKARRTDFPAEMEEKLVDEAMAQFNGGFPQPKVRRKWVSFNHNFTPVIRANGQMDLWATSDMRPITFDGTRTSLRLAANPSYVYIHIDKQGIRFTRIPKKASSIDMPFYYSFKNSILLFYMDNEKSLDEDVTEKDEKFFKGSRQKLFVAVISEDGTIRRQMLDVGWVDFNQLSTLSPSTLLAPKLTDFSVTGNNYVMTSKKTKLSWVTFQLE